MVLDVHRNHKPYWGQGEGGGGGGGHGGGVRDMIYTIATLSPPEWLLH